MASLHQLCLKHQITLACAESMTGGAFSTSITKVPYASKYFLGGIVSYSTQSKIDLLDVSPFLIQEFSVYSTQCVEAMAKSIQSKLNSQLSVAISGEAGRLQVDDYKEHLVYSCIIFNDKMETFKDSLSGSRNDIIEKGVELLHQRCISIIERGHHGKD